MSDWYAVQVVSGKEDLTCRVMRRLVDEEGLQEVFAPRYETQKKYRGEWRMCRSLLFPGYVMAVTPDVERLRLSLRLVPEFTRVLITGETYLPLDEPERLLIESLTCKGHRCVPMSSGVMEGDRVVVTKGPLVGHEGWIVSVNRQKSLAFLELQMFGRKVTTRVGLAILSKRGSS